MELRVVPQHTVGLTITLNGEEARSLFIILGHAYDQRSEGWGTMRDSWNDKEVIQPIRKMIASLGFAEGLE